VRREKNTEHLRRLSNTLSFWKPDAPSSLVIRRFRDDYGIDAEPLSMLAMPSERLAFQPSDGSDSNSFCAI
jgi:hypothetical protein